jgi:hypothetical protein
MGLSDIAAGVTVTEQQQEQGVATVDDTDTTLAERLAEFEASLPCGPDAAATILERYVAGGSVGAAGRAAGVPPVTAAKTLHLLGETVSPAGPTARTVVRDWIAGDLSRTDALTLSRLGETEFALAVYVETHDPLEAACTAVEGLLAARDERDQPLAETMSDATELL